MLHIFNFLPLKHGAGLERWRCGKISASTEYSNPRESTSVATYWQRAVKGATCGRPCNVLQRASTRVDSTMAWFVEAVRRKVVVNILITLHER